jgi:hypothetical protein
MRIDEPVLAIAFCGEWVLASTFTEGPYLSTSPSLPWVPARSGLPIHTGPWIQYSIAGNADHFYAGRRGGTPLVGGIYASGDAIHWTPFNEGLPDSAVVSPGGYQGIAVCGGYVFAIIRDSSGQNVWRRPIADPLPIQLLSFSAGFSPGKGVTLAWRTASETNNFGYHVQKAQSPEFYQTIPGSFVAGHGTTLDPQEYSFLDASGNGEEYYRLEQIDLDGTAHYSEGVRAAQPTATETHESTRILFSLDQNYPNPFNGETRIGFDLPERSSVTIRIFNMLGQQVKVLVKGERDAGHHELVFEAGGLPSGAYFCRMETGRGTQVRTLLLQR